MLSHHTCLYSIVSASDEPVGCVFCTDVNMWLTFFFFFFKGILCTLDSCAFVNVWAYLFPILLWDDHFQTMCWPQQRPQIPSPLSPCNLFSFPPTVILPPIPSFTITFSPLAFRTYPVIPEVFPPPLLALHGHS